MFKNRLEKIVWEEISNILKEADQEMILSLISENAGKLIPGPAGKVINSQKFLTLIRNRIAAAARGGALRGGEADYFISFVFPRAAQRVPGGGWTIRPGSQTARAHRARSAKKPYSGSSIDDATKAREGGGYASPKLSRPEQPGIPARRGGQRVQPPKSAGTVKDNLKSWPTNPRGAEAVEVRIADAAAKSRNTFRSQVRQKGGIKDKHLQNADDVIDDAFDDALLMAHEGRAGMEVAAFRERLRQGLNATKNSTKTSKDIVEEIGKRGRVDLKKGSEQLTKRAEQRVNRIKKQEKKLNREIGTREGRIKEIDDKIQGGVKKGEKRALRAEKKALEAENKALKERLSERQAARAKAKKRKEDVEEQAKKIDNMSDEAAGEAWIKDRVKKSMDDIDDAVRKEVDDFANNTTLKGPPGGQPKPKPDIGRPRGGSAQAQAAAERYPQWLKGTLDKTPKDVKNALDPALKEIAKDPGKLDSALAWVRGLPASTVQKFRDNPISAITATATMGFGAYFTIGALMMDSEDESGKGHEAATVEQAREGMAQTKDHMNSNLKGMKDRIAQSPDKAAATTPAQLPDEGTLEFTDRAKKYLEKVKDFFEKPENSTQKDKLNAIARKDAAISSWSLEKGKVILPGALYSSLVMYQGALLSRTMTVDAEDFRYILSMYINAALSDN